MELEKINPHWFGEKDKDIANGEGKKSVSSQNGLIKFR